MKTHVTETLSEPEGQSELRWEMGGGGKGPTVRAPGSLAKELGFLPSLTLVWGHPEDTVGERCRPHPVGPEVLTTFLPSLFMFQRLCSLLTLDFQPQR